ncbi:MAG: hypothetical protein JSS10_02625 [Verrucomicrobia bacterium]|nr:hypothetical protein [Verrucomicrobiota bacterium]
MNSKFGFWFSLSKNPSWKSWVGYAFESVCYKHIDQIRNALKIDPGSIAGTWRFAPKPKKRRAKVGQEGAQIDLLFDRPDNSITLCEIKCSEAPFAIDTLYAQMLQKNRKFFSSKREQKNSFSLL